VVRFTDGKIPKDGAKRMLNRKVPAVLATTALMILRNRLSERVWGSHGVNTLPIDDPLPDLVGRNEFAPDPISVGKQLTTIHPREARPIPSHSVVRPDLVKGIGIIGDSVSDEYRFYAPDRVTARNWVEILAGSRGLSFGDPVITSGVSTWDRRFAHNWSQSGATTTSLIAGGQHTGLAAQVADGAAISLAAVSIGTNDFTDVLLSSRSVVDMGAVLERASSNFAAILDSLLGINPSLRIAAFTAVDLSCSPLLRGALDSGLISTRLANAYGSAIADFNGGLRDLITCHGHRAVVVDINQLLAGIVEAERYVVGGLEINRIEASNDARHLFLSDGFHPGTIGQCLIANRFLDAINARFDAGVPLLSDEEMVRIADSVPRPSGFSLIGTGVLALFGYGRRRPRAA
jgi:lysophospholipase L1-like esterase